MNKLYYVKGVNYELAERYEDKLRFYNDMLEQQLMDGEITYKEFEPQQEALYKQIDELQNAMLNCKACEGYKFKAEWKYIEIINKYAMLKEIQIAELQATIA